MANDALGAHARDELCLNTATRAQPVQAALSSAASFVLGGALPLVALVVAPHAIRTASVVLTAIVVLAILGAAGAKTGGARIARAAFRVSAGGTLEHDRRVGP